MIFVTHFLFKFLVKHCYLLLSPTSIGCCVCSALTCPTCRIYNLLREYSFHNVATVMLAIVSKILFEL